MSRAAAARSKPKDSKARVFELSRGDVVGPGGRVGQFWTPAPVARAFAAWAGIEPGMRVIDLGSGLGALSHAALDRGARVTAVEVDERLVERTRGALEVRGAVLIHRDVLTTDRRQTAIDCSRGSFDLAVSNPPWEQDLVERFFEEMLARAPRAAAITPASILHGVERSRFWRAHEVRRLRFLRSRPSFDPTARGGGKRDVIFIELGRRGAAREAGDADRALVEVGG